MIISSEAAAYLAGLIEGEGWFGEARTKRNGKVYTYHRINVKMTDHDVLVGAQAMSGGMGQVCGPYQRPDPKHKEYWHWNIGNRRQLEELVTAMWPYLGQRRRAKIVDLGLNTHRRLWQR